MAKSKTGTPKRGGGRRSKAESMTEEKANLAEVNKVLDLKPIEIDEKDFNVHYRSIKSALEKKDTAVSLLRGARKQAKEASPDILAAVEETIKLERLDQYTIVTRLQRIGYALKKAESPIQLSLHNTLLGDANETAYKRGFKDGEAGHTANNDYPEGSDLAAEYTRGWNHGTAKNLGMSPEAADEAIAAGEENASNILWNDEAPHLTDEKVAA